MKKRILWIFAAAITAALMVSGAAFAEGEEPATVPVEEPAAEAIIAPAVDIPAVEEAQPVMPADELALIEDLSTAADTAPADFAPDIESVTPPVEESVNNMEPILADASGEPLELASQESAELIASGDPYWFVGTTKYQTVFNILDCPAGTAGLTCWAYAQPINGALTRIETGLLPTNRKLYIVGGTPFTENISIDGSSVFDFRKSQITGFIGMPDGLFNYPILNGNILLEGLKYGFSLSDFTINGHVSIQVSKGPIVVKNVKVKSTTGSGIVIGDETAGVYTRHLGNVTLDHVISNENLGSGAEIYSTGITAILNSAFNFNGGDGLTLNTLTGTMTMKNITAIGNTDFNVMISRFQNTLTITNAVLNKSQTDSGLYAVSTNSAPVTLDSVIANTNDDYGIYLKTNGAMTLVNVETSGSLNGSGTVLDHTLGLTLVQVKNSQFMNNGLLLSGNGLEITSKSVVLLNSINASGNMDDGLYIDNCLWAFGECLGSGNVTLTSPAGARWMNANYFEGNGDDGVEIHSFGIVTLSNFVSDGNSAYGLNIENHTGTNGILINSTLTEWFNTANGNTGVGIYLWSRGIVFVDNTNASHNGSYGLIAETNPLFVQITDGEFNDNFSGLYITSKNPVTINNVDANDNTAYGMYITVNAPKTVAVLGSSTLNNFNGIYISTLGSVLLSTVSVNDNTGYGARIEGCLAGTCVEKSNLIMNGSNTFNTNGGVGLQATMYGTILLNRASAVDNGNQGLLLDNVFANLTNGVSITNTSVDLIKGNTIGVEIYSKGTITLTSVKSNANSSFGAWLDNSSAATAKPLTLMKCTFESNGNSGVYADIHGSIYGYSLKASYNAGSGADLNNTDGGVVLTPASRISWFIDNAGQGLDIDSTGSVVLKNIKAELNGANGVLVDCIGNVSVSGDNLERGTSFSENVLDGLHVVSDGSITINSFIYANLNGSDGIYLNNQSAGSAKTINVSYSETNNNSGRGLWVLGNSAVKLVSVESQFNGDDGAYVENNSGLSGVVTVSGASMLSNNGGDGLELHTPLAAVVSGITANYNSWSGIYLTSASGLTTLSNIFTHLNTMNGIEINAVNKVLITGAKSFNNGNNVTYGDGLWIDSNNYDVVIKSSTFIGNFGNGIDVQPGTGVLTLTSTAYFGNDASNTGAIDDLFVH